VLETGLLKNKTRVATPPAGSLPASAPCSNQQTTYLGHIVRQLAEQGANDMLRQCAVLDDENTGRFLQRYLSKRGCCSAAQERQIQATAA
jgi:hypothetical protein